MSTTSSACAKKLTFAGRKLIRVAGVEDEEWAEGDPLSDPHAFVRNVRSHKPKPDVFTFCRPLPEHEVCHPFPVEWDNVAVAPLTKGFNHWWEELPQETRKNVRRSQRRGVTVKQVDFDDQLVTGITRIYNETPIRQGRKFWHYGKNFEQAKSANGTYIDRSNFIGAFLGSELIGFIKLVRVNKLARIMQIVALDAHTDKRPTNALLAKAVEICSEKHYSHLVYGKYVYGNKENSPVTEFKRRNGFERLTFPRYYVPITGLGALAIRCRLHKGLAQFLPENLLDFLLATRAAFYRRRFGIQPALRKSESTLAGVAQR